MESIVPQPLPVESRIRFLDNDDLLRFCFSFLPPLDLLTASWVSPQFRRIAFSSTLWSSTDQHGIFSFDISWGLLIHKFGLSRSELQQKYEQVGGRQAVLFFLQNQARV